MKNFRRAIHDSIHHWPALLLATLCACGVATLWGANIGALYPVVEMTLKGESIQNWLKKHITESENAIPVIQAQLVTAKTELLKAEEANNAEEIKKYKFDEKQKAKAIKAEESQIAWNKWWLSWADRYLPQDPFSTICWIMGLLIVSTVVKHILMLMNELLVGHVSTSIVRSLRMRVFEKSLALDRKTYQGYGTSGLLAAITNTSDAIVAGLMNFFGAAVREPLRIVSCLIGACLICPRLLLFSLILAPVMIWIVTYFNRRIRAIATGILGRNAGFHEVILEALSNVFTVQAYTMEKHEQERFSECTRDMRRFSMKLILCTGIGRPFTELIGICMLTITICAGAYLIVNQQTHIFFVRICNEPMSVSSLLIFFGLLIGASDPLRKLSGVFTSIYMGSIAADSLYQILDGKPIIAEPKTPVTLANPHGNIEIKNLSFAYDVAHPVLKEVNLEIPHGKTIAILGSNGSGKSTLIQLLGRYYDPTAGQICIDGVDYRRLSVVDIRRRIALVSQTTELFNRSVLENILYGTNNCTRDDAIAAAKMAHAHDFITQSLSQGYDTIVGQSGQRLSGGQRQRIALARAILRNPEVLILDESTSQIDMASEIQIRDTLQEMKGRFTIIIITHREALVSLADSVYEIRDGHLSPSQHQWSEAA